MSRVAADLVCRSLLCFGIAAAVGGLVRQPCPRQVEVPRDPCRAFHAPAAFGVYDEMGELVPSSLVPLVPGQQFGWRLDVGDEGVHSWREVLITPAAPRDWLGADLTVVADGKVGITERREVAFDGVLEHSWTITEGDPAGPHVIELYLDGRLVRTFSFLVAPVR